MNQQGLTFSLEGKSWHLDYFSEVRNWVLFAFTSPSQQPAQQFVCSGCVVISIGYLMGEWVVQCIGWLAGGFKLSKFLSFLLQVYIATSFSWSSAHNALPQCHHQCCLNEHACPCISTTEPFPSRR